MGRPANRCSSVFIRGELFGYIEIVQTALHSIASQAGAQFRELHGWQVPDHFGDWQAEYWALRQAAGIIDLSFRSKLAVTGSERTLFLHRMLSNEVKALQPGQGNYCFLLNPQGHILADINLLMQPERVLLDCEPQAAASLKQTLDRFIIASDVEVENISPRLGTIAVEGPLSREVICPALGFEPPHMKALDHLDPEASPDFVLLRNAIGEEGFWVIAPNQRLPELWAKLLEAARPQGGRATGLAALEVARIEAGRPLLGVDIEERTIPQETGQFRGLSFNKGCYPGQEIVERVRSGGHINRKLVGFAAPGGEVLRAGMKVTADGREAGHLTSAAFSPAAGKYIALGYLRREFAEPEALVSVDGVEAIVVPLPFPR
jgi:folate-binding protein YgfZ